MGLLPLQVRVEAREALTTFGRAHLSLTSLDAQKGGIYIYISSNLVIQYKICLCVKCIEYIYIYHDITYSNMIFE